MTLSHEKFKTLKRELRSFLNRNPDTCYLAIEADDVIGVIMVGNDGRRGYIYHTAVHPNYRK